MKRALTEQEKTWAVGITAAHDSLPDVPRLRRNESYWRWFLYTIIDPRTDVAFYVGCTASPRLRLKAHVSDPASAAFIRMNELREVGIAPRMEIVAEFFDKAQAAMAEAKLIAETAGALNLEKHPVGCACWWHRHSSPRYDRIGKRLESMKSERAAGG